MPPLVAPACRQACGVSPRRCLLPLDHPDYLRLGKTPFTLRDWQEWLDAWQHWMTGFCATRKAGGMDWT